MASASSRRAALHLPLNELISIAPRFGRSVHLEHDASQSVTDGAFHLTPSSSEALETLAIGLSTPAARATTLIGSYGAGKSALLVFLTQVLNGDQSARKILRAHNRELFELWTKPQNQLLPVIVIGAREPLAQALLRALEKTLTQAAPQVWRALQQNHAAALAKSTPAPRATADLFRDAARILKKSGDYAGVLLLCDELGKFLEYAALNPRDGDIFVLQELAESAARSGEAPLLITGVLHQDASVYATRLSRTQQNEWAKIAERFGQIPLFPSDVERMDLVGLALTHAPALSAQLNGQPENLAKNCAPFLPAGLSGRFADMTRAAYPLHPVALLALPKLFRRAGQSHRSLFNFLSGEEPGALGRFLREQSFDTASPPWYRLDGVFDYACDVLLSSHVGNHSGAHARIWAEAVETVERAQHVSPEISDLALRVLKSIALLSWLHDATLLPSREILGAAFESDDLQAALAELEARRLIAWSRARHAFRLWEGGDVDIEAEIMRARSELSGDVTLLAAGDTNLCPLPRLVARRHSFQTGILRGAEIIVVRPSQLQAHLTGARKGDNGLLVVLCLTQDAAQMSAAEAIARDNDAPQWIFGIAVETELLSEAAVELAAAAQLPQSVVALEHDRASRRELEARRAEAETLFAREWQSLFGVALGGGIGNASDGNNSIWIHRGQDVAFDDVKSFGRFLSQAADATFPNSPLLKNELLNRRSLSSAGASARRNLITSMLEKSATERLGIAGFPPEAAMYESVLRATGLHHLASDETKDEPQEESDARWMWRAPAEYSDTARLLPVWRELEKIIFAPVPREVALADLFAQLRRPPFGLSEGVLPVLLLAFLLCHELETTLYKDGAFLPEPRAADWEVLLRRPDLFAVAGCRVTGARSKIVERLAASLQEQNAVVPIVRRLLKMARALPEHAWKTRRLEPGVLRLRESIERARSPERWLFEELPIALGFGAFNEKTTPEDVDKFFASLNAALSQWSAALPTAIENARGQLLRACGLPENESGWKKLCAFATSAEAVLHPLTASLGARLQSGESDAMQLDSVLSLIAQRPPRSWGDAEIESFSTRAAPYGLAFGDVSTPASSKTQLMPLLLAAPLSKKEAQAADELARRLTKLLIAKDGAPLSRDVRRAALERLIAELENEK